MHQPARKLLPALICALGTIAGFAEAAPEISRLTPPSNALSADAVTLARFLPGQRFDLQATIRPDAGQAITSVEFKVDGVSLGTINGNGVAGNKSLVPATSLTASSPNAVSAYFRAYANPVPGVHALSVTATQSDGQVVSREGNFEVVGIVANNGRPAKNVIIMLGDGMGAAHRTAARIMAKGYAQGKAQGRLAMDTFPYTGMVMTASLDSIVTDSAPGMANYVTGNKANNNQEGVFPDDTTDAFDNPRIEYLSEYLHRTKGTSLGIVTTADVFDATPAANAVHTSNRGNGTGIVDQYLDDRKLTGLSVLMGGGRKWFLPNASNSTSPQAINGSQRKTSTDYVLPDDLVAGKMLIGYGANADRYETWQTYPQPTQDSQQPFVKEAPLNTYPANAASRTANPASGGFLISGQVAGEQAVHTATDIPLSAYGRGASLFTGVFDNTDVFFKLGQIAIGGAR